MAPGSPNQRAFRSIGRPLAAALAIGTVTFAAVPSAGAAAGPVSTTALSTAAPTPTAYQPLPASWPAAAEPVVAAPADTPPAPETTLPLLTTTARPGTAARVAIDFALAQRGLPYVWGGDGPGAGEAGFDCSGLTTAAYAAAGITLPRTAHTQFYAGPHVPDGALLEPGDLVFYGVPARVHHVGLYLGDGLMVNAPTFGKPVQIAYVRYSGDDYLGATRPAAGHDTPGLLTTPNLPYTVPAVPAPDAPEAPTEFPAPAAPVPTPSPAEQILAAAEGAPDVVAPTTTGPAALAGPAVPQSPDPARPAAEVPATSATTGSSAGAPRSTPAVPAPPSAARAAPGSGTSTPAGPTPAPPATAPGTTPPATTTPATPPGTTPPVTTPPVTTPPVSTPPVSTPPVTTPPAATTPVSAGSAATPPPHTTTAAPTTAAAAPTRLLLPATGTSLTLVATHRDANGLPAAPPTPTQGSLLWRPGTGTAWVAAVGLPAAVTVPGVGATVVVVGPDGIRTTLTVRSSTVTDPAAAKAAVDATGKGPRVVLVRTDPASGAVLVVVAS